ncbi:hypothetical protein GTR02_18365 [Kineococcus sp. R8]|uniref:hypothetical protein n=1 Tax=Kineococcus siccus TaxID=2696567 RepID=UPI00141305D1|nr:hypothetical protein [Kineococcus siccus]NAZ83781.1 hypothetical protein [Kineococcus siccus]
MTRRSATALLAWWVLLALATHSVVRYRWWLVAGYVLVAAVVVALAVTSPDDRAEGRAADPPAPGRAAGGRRDAVRRAVVRAGPLGPVVAVLVLTALTHLAVPAFTYVSASTLLAVQVALAAAALLAALLLLLPRRRAGGAALAVAVAASAGTSAAVVVGDPAPRIDVWVILQQAADGMAEGRSMYAQVWRGSPGITDAFAYLPWTAVLTAPGRWIAGDVRWAVAVLLLVTALLVAATGRWRRPAVGAAALLLLSPGTSTLVEQAWTEPTVLVGLAAWALLVARERAWWAVVPLAVALASKQHVVLLLPLLAVWPRFGLRRTAVATVGAGLLVAPWLLAGLRDFLHDTVSTMLDLPPLRFADTLYTALLNETGVQLPFAVVGALIGGVLVLAVVRLRRHPVGLPGLLTWCAAVLLVANLVNKQAFYNQYWLVGALLLTAVAARAGQRAPGPEEVRTPGAVPGRPRRPGRRAGRAAAAPGAPSPSAR